MPTPLLIDLQRFRTDKSTSEEAFLTPVSEWTEVKEWVMDSIALTRESLRRFSMTSSLIATNPLAVRGLMRAIEIGDDDCIVELGIARGTITRALLRMVAKEDTKVIAIELNKRFAEHALENIKDERLEVIHGDATQVGQIMKERRLKASTVISGIPHSKIPREQILSMMHEIRDQVLTENGISIIYNFTGDAHQMQKTVYGKTNVHVRCDISNLFPPLQISTARKPTNH